MPTNTYTSPDSLAVPGLKDLSGFVDTGTSSDAGSRVAFTIPNTDLANLFLSDDGRIHFFFDGSNVIVGNSNGVGLTVSLEDGEEEDDGNWVTASTPSSASVPTIILNYSVAALPAIDGGFSVGISIVEGTTAVTTIVGTVDSELGPKLFLLNEGDDIGSFTINSTTGVLAFATSPSFADPLDADGDNAYEVEVGLQDIVGNLATQIWEVTVTPASSATPSDQRGGFQGSGGFVNS